MPSLEITAARNERSPLDEDELRRMAAAAWHKHGIVVVDPNKIANDFDRQAVTNAANKLFGKRAKR